VKPNPVLSKLGFSNTDRVVIIHTDDIGMCHASTTAYSDLMDFGLISSAATMVPCSWFPQVAAYCRNNEKADMGVHLTLTSEWDTYRWGPVSTRNMVSGMIDGEGYFYRKSEEIQAHGDPSAVQQEIQSQLAQAINAGIVVTHIDTHMSTVAHPKFIAGYIQLAFENKLPSLFPRQDEAGYRKLGLDIETATFAVSFVDALEERGVPLIDNVTGLDLDQPNNRLEQAKRAFSELPLGVSHFIIHPSKDTPELRAITPDWKSRVADYETFSDEDLLAYIKNIGIHIIGYKQLKDLFRLDLDGK
jgi:predicted glycoside hydrolase/deacetylase ChbG (UPF0249 family)